MSKAINPSSMNCVFKRLMSMQLQPYIEKYFKALYDAHSVQNLNRKVDSIISAYIIIMFDPNSKDDRIQNIIRKQIEPLLKRFKSLSLTTEDYNECDVKNFLNDFLSASYQATLKNMSNYRQFKRPLGKISEVDIKFKEKCLNLLKPWGFEEIADFKFSTYYINKFQKNFIEIDVYGMSIEEVIDKVKVLIYESGVLNGRFQLQEKFKELMGIGETYD